MAMVVPVVLLALLLLVAGAAQQPPGLRAAVDDRGGLRISVGGDTYEVASAFSYPHMRRLTCKLVVSRPLPAQWHAIANYPVRGSAERCCMLCLQNEQCHAWSLASGDDPAAGSDAGTCWLHDAEPLCSSGCQHQTLNLTAGLKRGTGSGWNSLGGNHIGGEPSWSVSVSRQGDGQDSLLAVTVGTGAAYRLERRLTLAPAAHTPQPGSYRDSSSKAYIRRIDIVDTVTNLLSDDAPLGLAFDHTIALASTPRPECGPDHFRQWNTHHTTVVSPCLHIGGLRGNLTVVSDNYQPSNVPTNPTVFLEGTTSSLGAIATDTKFQLQLDLTAAQNYTAHLANFNPLIFNGFAVPPHSTRTLRWSIYAVESSTDYYDFINAARADNVLANAPARGVGGWLDHRSAASMSADEMRHWVQVHQFQTVIMDGPCPWCSQVALPGSVDYPNYTWYLEGVKRGCKAIKRADPNVACLIDSELSLGIAKGPGELAVDFPDSIALQPDGQPSCYICGTCAGPNDPSKSCRDFIDKNMHQFIYFPVISNSSAIESAGGRQRQTGNSYFEFLYGHLQDALRGEDALDGAYYDLFSLAAGSGGPISEGGHPDHMRWTYDVDNVGLRAQPELQPSLDLSPNFTISRFKRDLCLVSAEARAVLAEFALESSGGRGVLVVNQQGVSQPIRSLPINFFLEAITEWGYTATHLSANPMSLGWYPGYAVSAKIYGKEGTWWHSWADDKDWLADVKDKLRSAVLYHTYYPPPNATSPNILPYMYPITVRELHAGWIVGDERIITLHSGRFGWGASASSGNGSSAVMHCVDELGHSIARAAAVAKAARGNVWFNVEVPLGGVCVLVRPSV